MDSPQEQFNYLLPESSQAVIDRTQEELNGLYARAFGIGNEDLWPKIDSLEWLIAEVAGEHIDEPPAEERIDYLYDSLIEEL